MELAYPEDPPEILNRTARDFFVGSLTPIALRKKVLDLVPNTLDEALAAAQRYESNQQRKYTSAFFDFRGGRGCLINQLQCISYVFWTSTRGSRTPPWAKELFQQQAEILQKLKNIPQGRQESNVGRQSPRACFKCGSLTHLVRDCPSYINPDHRNLRRAGRSQK